MAHRQGRAAWITDPASGIGAAMALTLAAKGALVVTTDHRAAAFLAGIVNWPCQWCRKRGLCTSAERGGLCPGHALNRLRHVGQPA